MTSRDEIRIKNFFTWEIKNFNEPEYQLVGIYRKTMNADASYYTWPSIKVFDRYNNIERTAELRLKLSSSKCEVTITPPVKEMKGYYDWGPYARKEDMNDTSLKDKKFVLLKVYVDVVIPITVIRAPITSVREKLLKLYKADSSTEFTIRCRNGNIKALKPILAASSPVFQTMFQAGMKEAEENSMEIKEFQPEVVQKMIEFCETDNIAKFGGCEVDVFKIAHKYQMPDLMQCAIEEMIMTTTAVNRADRYKLAVQYDLEEFQNWLFKF